MKTKVLLTAWLVAGTMTAMAQEAENRFDSLESVANNTALPEGERLRACENLGYDLVSIDVEKALEYACIGLSLSKDVKNDSLSGSFYRELGMAYQVKANYDSAGIYYAKALSYALENRNEELESFLYLAYGLLYSDMSQYEASAGYYEKSLRLCEKLGLQKRYNTIILNIGITYLKMSNYERAEQYFIKAKEVFLKNPYPNGLANVYLNMGVMYCGQNRIKEAYEVSMESLKIFQSLGDKSGEAMALHNYVHLYTIDKKYSQALEAASKGLSLAEESGFNYVIQVLLSDFSFVYYAMGNYRLSEDYKLCSIEFIDSTETAELMIAYQDLTPIYIQQGKKQKALDAVAKCDSLTKIVNKVKVQNTYTELEIKYETEKKELQITALEKEKRLMIWLSLAGGAALLLALLTFFFLWRWTIQKKRLAESQKELAEQGKQLAEQQIKQLEQEKQLIATQAMFDGEVQERIRLARDLHDRLGGILSAMKYNLADMRKVIAPEPASLEIYNKTMELLDESMREMRRIAHHLMPDALSHF
jgi:tetratricopeptide (TPR) repeat protein